MEKKEITTLDVVDGIIKSAEEMLISGEEMIKAGTSGDDLPEKLKNLREMLDAYKAKVNKELRQSTIEN